MRRTALACLLSVLAVVGCDERAPEPVAKRPADLSPPAEAAVPLHCGGEAAPGAIDAYFRRLAEHLATGDDPVPMTFYAERFGVIDDGRRLSFRREEMGAGARALPSRKDWEEISRRGRDELEPAGYRGCMIAHGKVWFESVGDTVALIAFNKEMAW